MLESLWNFLIDLCTHSEQSFPVAGVQVCLRCGMRRFYVIGKCGPQGVWHHQHEVKAVV